MNQPPLPCRETPGDLWFSSSPSEQSQAAKLCQGCPLSSYMACQKEGWNHEFGVWGGLTELMRKRQNRRRFDTAVGSAKAHSDEIDRTVVGIRKRAEEDRIAHAAHADDVETIFELEGPDVAEMVEVEA